MTRLSSIALVSLIVIHCHGDLAHDVAKWTVGPYVAFAGDSITEGYPTHHSVICTVVPGPTGNTAFDIASNLWTYSSQLVTGTNFGVQSYKWQHVGTNGSPRALATRPRYLFLRCGVNDLSFSVPFSDVITNLDRVLAMCVASNALMVIQDIMPASTANDSLAAVIRTWNTNFDNWAATTSVRRIRDFALFGTNRPSTGQPDDLKPEYSADGLHITTNAYAAWARIAYTNLLSWTEGTSWNNARVGTIRPP